MKPALSLAAVGIVGLIFAKLLGFLILPIVGMFLGFFFLVLKIALIVGLIWFGFTLFRKWTDRPSEA